MFTQELLEFKFCVKVLCCCRISLVPLTTASSNPIQAVAKSCVCQPYVEVKLNFENMESSHLSRKPAKKRKVELIDSDSIASEIHMENEDDNSSGDSSSDEDAPKKGDKTDCVARLRKEKRLAMNRESARLRRKRKKTLIQSLESQVLELTTAAQEFQTANERLKDRLRSLEGELQIANTTIAYLMSLQQHGGRSSLPLTTALLARNPHVAPTVRQPTTRIDEDLNALLQAQAANITNQRNTDTVRSLYLREDSIGRVIDANRYLHLGSQLAPLNYQHPSLYRNLAYTPSSPLINAESLENVVREEKILLSQW
jgi:bZIP transcription factor